MSYIINKTDGTVLTEVVDGTIDQIATDITLIGKNSSTYGEFLNENFVKLLENFANTSAPNNPVAGQLWFDTTENRLKVYDGNGFRVSGGTLVAASVPSGLVQGDLWIDSVRKQLFFYDGTQLTLAGPPYTTSQGLTGFTIESILDTNQISHTVALLYVGQALLGIFSKDEFLPATSITGYSGKIYTGFNASTLSGMEFNTIAKSARQIIANDGSVKTAESFLQTTGDSATVGKFSILNTKPLILGPGSNYEVQADSIGMNIVSNNSGQDFAFKIKNVSGTKSALQIKATSERVGILTDDPQATLDVNGDVIIKGDLLVEGDTTTINTSVLNVEDSYIELAKTDVPTDDLADGGGIVLKGTTDHSITWNKDTFDVALSNWNFSENISLDSGKSYKINNVNVLTATSLGNNIASAPGLTSLGHLTVLRVNNLGFGIGAGSNTISALNTNGDIVLTPNGVGAIDASSARIKNLADPVDPTDAVSLQYFQQYVTAFPLGLTLDITELSAVTPLLYNQIATILNDVYPASEHPAGTLCKIYTTRQTVTFPALTITTGTSGSGADIIRSYVSVNKGSLQENQSVLQDFSVNPIDTGNATITYTRQVYVFEVNTNQTAWDYVNDFAATALPT